MTLPIYHKRYKPEENRSEVDEENHIVVPGASFFDKDHLYKWFKENADKSINVDLLFHKFPRWFKELGGDGAVSCVVKDYAFEIPRGKKANPNNPYDYKKETHDYKKEHLEDIEKISRKQLGSFASLKNRHFFDTGFSFTLKTKTRLLVGFAGGDTVLENSISLHPYYGFPVIPGSSLKGLTRHYCDEFEDMDKNMVLRIFGSESGDKDAREGEVIFMDSWPEEWPAKGFLELDVMSPHFTGYYDKKSFPTDSSQPVPILFLAVRRGVRFRFAVLPSRACRDTSIVGLAKCCLEKALKTFGAGAKTGSSYGYFE